MDDFCLMHLLLRSITKIKRDSKLRIVNDAGNDGAFAFERDRDRKMRYAVQEVGSAVERIDDEGMGLVRAFTPAAFFAEKAIAGPRMQQLLVHDFLGAAVGGGDEIARPFE